MQNTPEKLPKHLLQIIQKGERSTTEFKEAKKGIPSTLFESICGMLNCYGGHIFLGIDDDKNIIGVTTEHIAKLRKTVADLCNNPEKIYPTVRLEIKEFTYDSKHLLYIFVYESSDVHNSAGRIYIRNEDGDYDITGNTQLVSNLYLQKHSTYTENKIFPYAEIKELRKSTSSRSNRQLWQQN